MPGNNQWVENILKESNISMIGFADLSEIDSEARLGYRYGICIAAALWVLPSATDKPSVEYYEEYMNVSGRLRKTCDFLAEKIRERGYSACSLAHEKQNEEFRTRLPLKTLATRAGLGWIGKPSVLVTKEYGSAVRLSGVLTDMPLIVGTPVNKSFCGACEECVRHCPGHAIKGNIWTPHMDRDNLLDASACKKKITERGRMNGIPAETCGICITELKEGKDIIS